MSKEKLKQIIRELVNDAVEQVRTPEEATETIMEQIEKANNEKK